METALWIMTVWAVSLAPSYFATRYCVRRLDLKWTQRDRRDAIVTVLLLGPVALLAAWIVYWTSTASNDPAKW